MFISNNDEDEKNNQIIIDEDTYVDTPSEEPAFKYLDGDTYTNQPDGLSFKKTNVVFARTKAAAEVHRLNESGEWDLWNKFEADSCDPALVKFESGSIKVTLQQAYLDSLPDGTYALLIDADKTDDDNAEVAGEFIVNKSVPAPVPTYSAPKTSDNSQLLLWAGMMIVAVIGMVAFGKKRTATDR